ncbi:MAG TPA: hypothetical protein VHR72_02135 [Gemmataceae bacterium]|jgi:hypothetical protein|nr:hypothetical protein [Gemmataceae bacterium]
MPIVFLVPLITPHSERLVAVEGAFASNAAFSLCEQLIKFVDVEFAELLLLVKRNDRRGDDVLGAGVFA